MKLLWGKGKAKDKWRRKAWLVDMNKTRIILVSTESPKPRHAPPWVGKKELDPSIRSNFAINNIRKEYGLGQL